VCIHGATRDKILTFALIEQLIAHILWMKTISR